MNVGRSATRLRLRKARCGKVVRCVPSSKKLSGRRKACFVCSERNVAAGVEFFVAVVYVVTGETLVRYNGFDGETICSSSGPD